MLGDQPVQALPSTIQRDVYTPSDLDFDLKYHLTYPKIGGVVPTLLPIVCVLEQVVHEPKLLVINSPTPHQAYSSVVVSMLQSKRY